MLKLKLGKRLGRGGFGVVFQASLKPYGDVAVKLELPARISKHTASCTLHGSIGSKQLHPLASEAKAMLAVDSAYVARCLDYGIVPAHGCTYLVMELAASSVCSMYSSTAGLPVPEE